MKKRNKHYLPLENTVFKIRQLINTVILKSVDFDIDKEIKYQMARKLADLIIEHKKFAIQKPMDKLMINLNMGEFLNSMIDQNVEYSLELAVMTREELNLYAKARILSLTYAEFTKLKKENKKWHM